MRKEKKNLRKNATERKQLCKDLSLRNIITNVAIESINNLVDRADWGDYFTEQHITRKTRRAYLA